MNKTWQGTAGQRNRILRQGANIGYTGNNLGQLSVKARGVLSNPGDYTAGQRRTAQSISSAIGSNSG
jgi:hypothetical protein